VFGEVLVERGIGVDRVLLYDGEPLTDWRRYDVIVAMGAGASVWEEDEYPWIAGEKRAIREAVLAGSSALRAAVYRGDGRAVVDLLRGVGADDDSLQLVGDGVIAAVMQRVDGAAELARKLVVGLRKRSWDGDDELADQLEAQLGSRPAAMLRALPVDLEELAGILEGDPLSVGGRIDTTTGEVWPQAAIDYSVETGEEDEDTSDDPERWLAVHGEGSREGYRDMELFIASVEDPGRAERLAIAIKGRGAFRRFKDELACWPGELERWHAFSEERQRGRARSWLAAAGYRVLPVNHRDS
jgi:hypothetical protein